MSNKYIDKLIDMEKSAGLNTYVERAKEVGGVLLGKNVQKADDRLQKTYKVMSNAAQRDWAAGKEYGEKYDAYSKSSVRGLLSRKDFPNVGVHSDAMVKAHTKSIQAQKRHSNLIAAGGHRRNELADQQILTNQYRKNALKAGAGVAVVGAAGAGAYAMRSNKNN